MAFQFSDQESLKNNTTGRDTAIVVHPVLPSHMRETGTIEPDEEDQIREAIGLARAISLHVVNAHIVKLNKVTPATLIGSGKCEELAADIKKNEPTVVIINHNLSPVQQRNLERQWDAKVIDRTGLILEIFGERAETREGQIQVELAALEYQKSRLVRSWTHLERQRGGAGFMGGPGETQIEIDRRLITDRIVKLKRDLEQVRKNRDLQRQSRERVPYPIVALIGYTNAGKSTLFNRLTAAEVFAEDLLFATLDPTMRKLTLENGQDVILADTVGFISDLPTHLVAAFRSTLEQVRYADIVLHIMDVSQPDYEAQRQDVIETLEALDIEYETDPRILEILNKIDAVPAESMGDIRRYERFNDKALTISALNGDGVEALLQRIENIISAHHMTVTYQIPPKDGKAISWLYEHGNVLEREDTTTYIKMMVDLDPADYGRFQDGFTYEPVSISEDEENVAQPEKRQQQG